jgi:G3E family GTPase
VVYELVEAGIQTTLVAGGSAEDRACRLLAMLARKPAGERWALLVSSPAAWDMLHAQATSSQDPDVFPALTAGGCPCCTLAVVLQRDLNQLLARSRPQCLFLEVPDVAHTDRVTALLLQPWYKRLLQLTA